MIQPIEALPANATIAILGAGLSGRAAHRLTTRLGYGALLFDQSSSDAQSGFDLQRAQQFAAIIISPGFEAGHPWRLAAENSGKPCWGELGFAAMHWKGKLYAVTGTNGKTSTTRLFRQACQAAGFKALAVGNIGTPLSDVILSAHNREQAIAICEISSFQAEWPQGLSLDGLLWLNFAEDHLDRYPNMQAYYSAKAKLLSCLKGRAPAVLPAAIRHFLAESSCAQQSYFYSDQVDITCDLESASPFYRQPFRENYRLLKALWKHLALPEAPLRQAANSSSLPEHRLQLVYASHQLCAWDDSKATNFDACLAAVQSLRPKPIIWIGGGASKGGELHSFVASLGPHIQQAFVYGEVAPWLQSELSQQAVTCYQFLDFASAVHAALEYCQNQACGEHAWQLLLSPGFSSLDQFISYAERGKCFQSIVFSLLPTQNVPLLRSL